MSRRRNRKARSRGTATETVLGVLALMGCFVYPAAQTLRDVGNKLTQEHETAHDKILEPPPKDL